MDTKKQHLNKNISFVKGLFSDSSPDLQGEGHYSYALNATDRSVMRELGYVYFEESNAIAITLYSELRYILGSVYMTDSRVCIISSNGEGKDEIGVYSQEENTYTAILKEDLNLSAQHQIDMIFRTRMGCEETIYFTDNLNPIRYYNLSRPELFLNTTGQFDPSRLSVFSSFSTVPAFERVDVLNSGGQLLPGGYVICVQYLDDDYNPTEVVLVSEKINIYNDSMNLNYFEIQGSTNLESQYTQFPNTNKSILVKLSNMDPKYTYYRLLVVKWVSGNGEVTEVDVTDITSTYIKEYTYNGDNAVGKMSIEQLQTSSIFYETGKNLSIVDNSLVISNLRGLQMNACVFQRFASKIKSNLILQKVTLNNIHDSFSPKNPMADMWYMPGEIYSFGIRYLFEGGYKTPAFHIPGKSVKDTSPLNRMSTDNLSSSVQYSESNRNSCLLTEGGFWGKDYLGNPLQGEIVRHHRFPTRRDVGVSLYTTNSGSESIKKELVFKYKNTVPAGSPVTSVLTNIEVVYLTTDDNTETVLFSDVSLPFSTIAAEQNIGLLYNYASMVTLTVIPKPGEAVIEKIGYNILPGGGDTADYTTYAFGIDFSNIDLPTLEETNGKKIIGFEILRQSRRDSDKTILDSAILTVGMVSKYYSSIGMFCPDLGKQSPAKFALGKFDVDMPNPPEDVFGYFPALSSADYDTFFTPSVRAMFPQFPNNTLDTLATLVSSYSGNLFGILTPEHRFNNKESYPTEISIEGFHYQVNNNRGQNVIQDVQDGTSYDPEVHKKKYADFDGFSLRYVVRKSNKKYVSLKKPIIIPQSNINELYYLDALFSNSPKNNLHGGNEVFNVSGDNRMGALTIQKSLNPGLCMNKNPYVILKRRLASPYSTFEHRPYYKVNQEMYVATNGDTNKRTKIFGGDTTITHMSPTTSIYVDTVIAGRAQKSSILSFIAGILIVVGAVVGAFFTGGATLAALGPGISLITAGLRLERAKEVYLSIWERGLKYNVMDGDGLTNSEVFKGSDDEVRWVIDNAGVVFMESSVNMELRFSPTVDVPSTFKSFGTLSDLIEYGSDKLTALDPNRGNARGYRGYPMAEVNMLNPDYFKQVNLFSTHHIPETYNCCSDCIENFPNRIIYSNSSLDEQITDSYRTFLPNNFKDMPSSTGPINNTVFLGNSFYVHAENALYELPRAHRETVTNNIITFVGDGSVFSLPPKKLIEDSTGNTAGLVMKFSTCTFMGAYFFMSSEGYPFILDGGKLEDISIKGMKRFFTHDNKFYNAEAGLDNPAGPGVGYHSIYDAANSRLLITKVDRGGSWTLGYSISKDSWISFYSYIPNRYISIKQNMLSYQNDLGKNSLWKHGEHNSTLKFYGEIYPFIIDTTISTVHDLERNVNNVESVAFSGEYYEYDSRGKLYVRDLNKTYTKGLLYNSYQCSGEIIFNIKQDDEEGMLWNSIQEDSKEITLSRVETRYSFNKIRNLRKDYNSPIFLDNSEIRSTFTKGNTYFENKILNIDNLSEDINWTEKEIISDDYLGIRLVFDNQVDDSDIKLRYVSVNDTNSFR